MTNEFKSPVPGSMHEAILVRVLNIGDKIQAAVPAHLGGKKNFLGPAKCDLPTAVYLECEGYTKGDVECSLIVAMFLDVRSNEIDVRFSYGDESGRRVEDQKILGFFDDPTPAIEMVKAHLNGL